MSQSFELAGGPVASAEALETECEHESDEGEENAIDAGGSHIPGFEPLEIHLEGKKPH
jgi:hypothetical protein